MKRIPVPLFPRPQSFRRPVYCPVAIPYIRSRALGSTTTGPVSQKGFQALSENINPKNFIIIRLTRLPVLLSNSHHECTITLSCEPADFSRSDDLVHGIDYARIREDVLKYSQTREHSQDPVVFLYHVTQYCLKTFDSAAVVDTYLIPRFSKDTHVADTRYHLKAARAGERPPQLMVAANKRYAKAFVGLTESERAVAQPLKLSCRLYFLMSDIEEDTTIEQWSSRATLQGERTLKTVLSGLRYSPFKTLETLASRAVDTATELNSPKPGFHFLQKVKLSVEKSQVFPDGTLPSVEISRSVSKFLSSDLFAFGHPRQYELHRAFIAIGSNVGDRMEMIERACAMMLSEGIKVIRTSSLYETEAMYVVDQGRFLNGVCQIETNLSPLELLHKLKSIEKAMGRQKTVDKGPRNIDLDIALYDDIIFKNEELTIPHASMFEREFVLRPLCDLIPWEGPPLETEKHYDKKGTARDVGPRFSSWPYYERLLNLDVSASPMSSVTPLSPGSPFLTAQSPTKNTAIMAVVNLTPDSFSDGGKHDSSDLGSLSETIKSHIRNGATIIDIGGQSTRPHAKPVTAEEEIRRILPAIQAARSFPEGKNVCISVDTYRAEVAEAAVAAGADLINDVSAGTLDEDMLKTVAKLGCTVCLMHMRGIPETMNSLTDYPDGLIPTIGAELLARVQAAEVAGIKRWRIILDPGIGFAKTAAQNIEIIKSFDKLRRTEGLQGLPWLVGASRKGFIGKITGVKEPSERSWGTAAAVTAAVQNGADIVRVHDVAEMSKVVKMADAIWRSGGL